ncbi:MAG TPA: CpsB/CapC family capsule biosynthesis tyrosine phosphatase [Cytophagaceae bacterium]|jgi:tyrosine-protein phosphatase YwqE
MNFFGLFNKKKEEESTLTPILVDMHSHLLPGIDDGSESLEDSINLIKEYIGMGYKKLITTPHIMGDFFKNTPEIIREKLALLNAAVNKEGLDIKIEAAAEYYLDEWFLEKLNNEEPLLTFGENYVLIETSYLNEHPRLNETIFLLKAKGYWPVLAHPERYTYLYNDFKKYQEIYDRGISFQLNINSLAGYYSKTAQAIAIKLVEREMISFAGSDCHSMKHLDVLKKTRLSKEYKKLQSLYLLNNSLL